MALPTRSGCQDGCKRASWTISRTTAGGDIVLPDVLEAYRPYRMGTVVPRNVAVLTVDLFAGVFPNGPAPVLDATRTNPDHAGAFA